MKILLTAINAKYTHSNLANIYIQSFLEENHVDSTRMDFSINQQLTDIIESIYLFKPDILTFSIYIWNSKIHQLLLSDIVKILPNTKIIIGGPEVTYNINQWVDEFPEITHFCKGYAENCFQELLENNWQIDDQVIEAEFPIPQLKFPYTSSKLHDLQNKYIYYEASRGCPFRCSYCLSSRKDHKLFQKNSEKVKEELTLFIQNKVKIVKFVDRTFNSSPKFSREIWQFLIDKNPDSKFHFEIYPTFLSDEDFTLLNQAKDGLFQFEIGIQTIHKKTLDEINRFGDWQKIKEKIVKLKDSNIHLHLDQIIGLPFENFEMIKQSFNEIYGLKIGHFQLGFLKILYGTEMAGKVDEYELVYSENPPYQIISNKWLSFDEIVLLQKIAHLIEGFDNPHKFKQTLSTLENNYETYFDFWKDLATFFINNKLEIHISWQNSAKNFLAFAVEKSIDLLDSLRWDWHLLANSHYYPEFINNPNLIEIKKENYCWVKDYFKIDENKHYDISQKILKKAIFYQNSDGSMTTISFIKDKKRKIFKLDKTSQKLFEI